MRTDADRPARIYRGARTVALLVGVTVLVGCESGPAAGQPAQQTAVYVCTETQEAFVGRPQAVPAEHPDTGRLTLMPGVYNPETQHWQPMPPLELLDGNPGAVVDRDADEPLTAEGPTDGLRRLTDFDE